MTTDLMEAAIIMEICSTVILILLIVVLIFGRVWRPWR